MNKTGLAYIISSGFTIHYLYGEMKLEKEFVWIARKTIRGWIFNKYEYSVHTPYLKMYCENLDEAIAMKFRFEH